MGALHEGASGAGAGASLHVLNWGRRAPLSGHTSIGRAVPCVLFRKAMLHACVKVKGGRASPARACASARPSAQARVWGGGGAFARLPWAVCGLALALACRADEERARRLAEMSADASAHEAARTARLADRAAKDAESDGRIVHAEDAARGQDAFRAAASKAVFGAMSSANVSVSERVGSRKHFVSR